MSSSQINRQKQFFECLTDDLSADQDAQAVLQLPEGEIIEMVKNFQTLPWFQ